MIQKYYIKCITAPKTDLCGDSKNKPQSVKLANDMLLVLK